MARKTDFFDKIIVIRDQYKNAYNQAKQARKAAMDDLKANYRKNSPRWEELTKQIPEEFNTAIEEAKTRALHDLEEATEHEKMILTADVKASFKSSTVKELQGLLSMLDGCALTIAELQTLADCYGNRSYWCDRLLENFCAKHGMVSTPIQPDFATKLEVIEEMNGLIERLLKYYDGNDSAEEKTFASTHTNVIDAAEARYTNDFAGVSNVPQEKAVRRALHAVYGAPDIMEQSQALANVLRTSSGATRDAIIGKLIKDGRLPEAVLKFSHFDKVAAEYTASKAIEAEEVDNPYYAKKSEIEGLSDKQLKAAKFYSALKGSLKITADSLKQLEKELPDLTVADITRYESGYFNMHSPITVEAERVRDTAASLREVINNESTC